MPWSASGRLGFRMLKNFENIAGSNRHSMNATLYHIPLPMAAVSRQKAMMARMLEVAKIRLKTLTKHQVLVAQKVKSKIAKKATMIAVTCRGLNARGLF